MQKECKITYKLQPAVAQVDTPNQESTKKLELIQPQKKHKTIPTINFNPPSPSYY